MVVTGIAVVRVLVVAFLDARVDDSIATTRGAVEAGVGVDIITVITSFVARIASVRSDDGSHRRTPPPHNCWYRHLDPPILVVTLDLPDEASRRSGFDAVSVQASVLMSVSVIADFGTGSDVTVTARCGRAVIEAGIGLDIVCVVAVFDAQ